jgi:hypothetical protein
VAKEKIFFKSKMKDGSTQLIGAIKTFAYFGERFAFHKRIVPNDKPESTTFSVSHIATGICLDAGFGYENYADAKAGTQVYLETVGKKEFKAAIAKAKQ